MSQTPIFHGSDLEQIASYYHIESDEICCFSANVNPLGFPEQTALAVCKNFSHLMSRYPDRNYIGLRAAIGRYCHISPDYVSVGNGSTELIFPFDPVLSKTPCCPGRTILLGIRAGITAFGYLLLYLVSEKGRSFPDSYRRAD